MGFRERVKEGSDGGWWREASFNQRLRGKGDAGWRAWRRLASMFIRRWDGGSWWRLVAWIREGEGRGTAGTREEEWLVFVGWLLSREERRIFKETSCYNCLTKLMIRIMEFLIWFKLQCIIALLFTGPCMHAWRDLSNNFGKIVNITVMKLKICFSTVPRFVVSYHLPCKLSLLM